MRRSLTALACLVTSGFAAFAQTGNVTFEHYTLDDGLSNNVVTSIAQDRFGFIWVATEDGVNRFDGYGFASYKHDPHDSSSIASSIVFALCTDSAGNIWLGTGGGLDRYDPGPDGFVHYGRTKDGASIFAGGVKRLAADAHGSLVIVTGLNGLLRFDPIRDRMERLIPDAEGPLVRSINCIYPARDGTIWFSAQSPGMTSWDPRTRRFGHPGIPHGGRDTSRPPVVTAIREDGDGNLWYGTFGGGVGRFNPRDGSFLSLRRHPGDSRSIGEDYVTCVLPDAHGRVWAGTYSRGLDRYDPTAKSFDHYPHDPNDPKSLSSQRIYALFEDRQGSVWVGTWQGGLSVFHPWRRKFVQVHHDRSDPGSLSNDTVWALCEDSRGRLWVGTEGGGLNMSVPGHPGFTHFSHDEEKPGSLSRGSILSLEEDHAGRLWIGTYGGGLDRFDERRRSFIHYRHDSRNHSSIPSDRVSRIIEDHDHYLWLGSEEGFVTRFDPETGKFRKYEISDPRDSAAVRSEIEAMVEDGNGSIWIGTFGSGLFRLDAARDKFQSYMHASPGARSLPVPGILSLAADGAGDLWVGTFAGGLFRYSPGSGSFEAFTEREGLPSNYVKGILPDGKGNLWLSSIKGLARFNVAAHAFRAYDESDGVQSNEFRTGAYCGGRGGKMYFGGVRGFNEFNPDSMADNPLPPAVFLTAFRIFDQPVRLGRPLADIPELELSYTQNFFSFEFVALDYTVTKKNSYAYKLEGFDRDWVTCGTRRFASYTHLDGGEYVFRVRGSNNDGVWTPVGASIRLVITPPFWETWWFQVLLIALIAGVPFLVYRNRFRRLLAVEQTRSRIARDLHDELSATLSGINFFAQAISKDRANSITPTSARFLSLIHESAGVLQDSISDIIWSVNPGHDRWEDIVSKFRRYASDLLDSKSVAYTFDFPDVLPSGIVAMDRRRNLWLIYKEIVTNAARHSRCANVSIALRFPGDRSAELLIKDDGAGFAGEGSGSGNGLRNIRSRAESAGIETTLTTAPGKGTSWHIRLRW